MAIAEETQESPREVKLPLRLFMEFKKNLNRINGNQVVYQF